MIPFAFGFLVLGQRRAATPLGARRRAADVLLWRNRNISAEVLGGVTAIWILFECLGYHLLTFVCHGLIFSLGVLFLWSNASSFINKSPTWIPEVIIPEDLVVNIALSTRYEINRAFVNLRQIALGRDIKKFLMLLNTGHRPPATATATTPPPAATPAAARHHAASPAAARHHAALPAATRHHAASPAVGSAPDPEGRELGAAGSAPEDKTGARIRPEGREPGKERPDPEGKKGAAAGGGGGGGGGRAPGGGRGRAGGAVGAGSGRRAGGGRRRQERGRGGGRVGVLVAEE
uniref:Reticulon-like protein n=1 Tax=Setaria viridis TaxID=4556 RepID=A0A4U6TSX1_SETVI|nr:hypothetical protein SEVIR_7G067500v2 [Setaria viridis]